MDVQKAAQCGKTKHQYLEWGERVPILLIVTLSLLLLLLHIRRGDLKYILVTILNIYFV